MKRAEGIQNNGGQRHLFPPAPNGHSGIPDSQWDARPATPGRLLSRRVKMRIDYNLSARYPGPSRRSLLTAEAKRQAEAEWATEWAAARTAAGPHSVTEREVRALLPRPLDCAA